MALQHLRASTADKRPTPAAMADGQLAMNTNLASPGLFFKDSNGDLVKTGPVHVGTTAPNATPASGGQAGNSKGELWLDTTGSDYTLKTWDGSAWREIVVTSTMIKDGTIVNADVNASAAIAGTKVAPDFGSQNVVTTGTATAASLNPTGSSVPTNGVYLPAANSVAISTNGVERVKLGTSEVVFNDGGNDIDFRIEGDTNSSLFFVDASTDRVGIGTTSPGDLLSLSGSSSFIAIANTTASATNYIGTTTSGDFELNAATAGDSILLKTTGTERARIDSSGRLLVGTSTSMTVSNGQFAKLQMVGNSFNANNDAIIAIGRGEAATAITDGEGLGKIAFTDNAGGVFCEINGVADGTAAANDYPGRLVFSTTADGASSPTERMRIDNAGNVLVGTTSTISAGSGTTDGVVLERNNAIVVSRNDNGVGFFRRRGTDGVLFQFYKNTSPIGSINVTGSATAYNTSSDYRLKENVVSLTGAIDRLQRIPVHRFNFIADPDTVVDGFIAHEAQEVVPECVTGEKDAVDDEGNPVYQGIDQSKLVPLLTAALQEAIGRIETLEAKVAALEGV